MLLWLVSLMSPVFCWVTLMPSTEPAVWLVFKLRGASGEVTTNQSAGQRWVRHQNKQIHQWIGFDLCRKSVLRHRWIYMSSRVCGCLWGAHVTARRPSRHDNHQISTSSHFGFCPSSVQCCMRSTGQTTSLSLWCSQWTHLYRMWCQRLSNLAEITSWSKWTPREVGRRYRLTRPVHRYFFSSSCL